MAYQLLHTSPMLTGQIRWDVIMSGSSIDSLRIAPLSDAVSYNYTDSAQTLLSTHSDNVKRLYAATSDTFFDGVCDNKIDGSQIVRAADTIIDTHVNDYEMSMRRMDVSRCGKQFSFLCPVWFTTADEMKNVSFRLSLINADSGSTIAVRKIRLCDNVDINNYVDELISQMTDSSRAFDDMIYIDYTTKQTVVNGLNAETGVMSTITNSVIVDDMLSRERTVYEFDKMICTLMSNNKIVCNQLVNFNLCFDLNDFIVATHTANAYYENMRVKVEVFIGAQQCDIRDIYTNYEFIPKYDANTAKYLNYNVLDHKKDYKYINDVNENKIVQSVCHFALRSNPSMSFNMYDGYAPVYTSKDGDEMLACVSSDFPELYDNTDKKHIRNTFCFCKYHNMTDVMNSNNFISIIEAMKADDSNFYSVDMSSVSDSRSFWFGNLVIDTAALMKRFTTPVNKHVHYATINVGKANLDDFKDNNIQHINNSNTAVYINSNSDDVYMIFIISDIDSTNYKLTAADFFNVKNLRYISSDNICKYVYRCMFFNGNDEDYLNDLAFKNSFNTVSAGNEKGYEYFSLLVSMMNTLIQPTYIRTGGSITGVKTDGPATSDEIRYVNNSNNVMMLRYSGALMPYFITPSDELQYNNIYYCKQYINNISSTDDIDDITSYALIAEQGYAPQYPSINYVNYNVKRLDVDNFYINGFTGERRWFNASAMRPMEHVITLHHNSTADQFDAYECLYKYVEAYANANDWKIIEPQFRELIYNKYDVSYTYDYVDDKTIDTFKFIITYKLK